VEAALERSPRRFHRDVDGLSRRGYHSPPRRAYRPLLEGLITVSRPGAPNATARLVRGAVRWGSVETGWDSAQLTDPITGLDAFSGTKPPRGPTRRKRWDFRIPASHPEALRVQPPCNV